MNRNIICQSCGKTNQVNNIEKYVGKKVRLTCLNTACNKPIIIDLTEEIIENDQTVLIKPKVNLSSTATLVHVSADGIKKYITLSNTENIIGRPSAALNSATIVIENDPYLSRKQFNIQCNGSEYIISVYKSKNQTYLNEKAVKEGDALFLKNGDKIVAGKSAFIFTNAV